LGESLLSTYLVFSKYYLLIVVIVKGYFFGGVAFFCGAFYEGIFLNIYIDILKLFKMLTKN